MLKKFIFLLLMLFLLFSSSNTVLATPYAEAIPSSFNIENGDPFSVDIWGHENGYYTDNFVSWEWLDFTFQVTTPSFISFESHYIDPLLFMDNSIYWPEGYVTGMAFPGLPLFPDLLLSTIDFKAIAPGNGLIQIIGHSDSAEGMGFWFDPSDPNAIDPNTGYPLDAFFDIFFEIEVNVTESTSVPEPASILLLSTSCLVGLGVIRRRKNRIV